NGELQRRTGEGGSGGDRASLHDLSSLRFTSGEPRPVCGGPSGLAVWPGWWVRLLLLSANSSGWLKSLSRAKALEVRDWAGSAWRIESRHRGNAPQAGSALLGTWP